MRHGRNSLITKLQLSSQSTFQVHTVTKETGGHDGATARAVGVAALAGIAAVLLMG